jgi:hypothetical protein
MLVVFVDCHIEISLHAVKSVKEQYSCRAHSPLLSTVKGKINVSNTRFEEGITQCSTKVAVKIL